MSHSASAIKIHWTCIKSHRCNPFEFSIEPWKWLPYGTKKLVNFIITKFIRFFLISTFESKTFFFVLCDDKNNLSVRDKLRFYISLFLLGCWLQSIWIFINRWAVCRKNMNVFAFVDDDGKYTCFRHKINWLTFDERKMTTRNFSLAFFFCEENLWWKYMRRGSRGEKQWQFLTSYQFLYKSSNY